MTTAIFRLLSPFRFAPVLLAALVCSAPATAGLISLSAAPLSSNGAEISSLGRTVTAWNLGATPTAPTINGVTFSSAQPSDIAFSGFPAIPDQSNPASVATATHYSTTAMQELMRPLVGTDSGSSPFGLVTFSGLTIGMLYQTQFLHHQDVDQNSRNMRVHFGGSVTVPDTDNTINFNVGDNDGYITTFLFTADATSQVFRFTTDGGSNRAILNAVALTAVPEPSSLALGALGLIGLYFVARRR